MPLSAENRAALKALYNALADRVLLPETDQATYEPRINGSPDGKGVDAVLEMFNQIDYEEGGGVCLFSGQRGTGKSTELMRLRSLLDKPATQGTVAFYADMSEYILLTKPIEITDFLISMAGALSDQIEADPRFSKAVGKPSYWERLGQFLNSTVEFKDAGVKIDSVADIKFSLKNDPGFKQRLQQAARGHVARIVREAHQFFAEVVAYLRTACGRSDLKVVFIVDSVERIRGVGDEDMTVFDSVRNLFFAHAEHLRIPLLHMVYTVPPYLSVLAAGAGTLMGGATVRRLVSTHIFVDRTREVDEAGLGLMRQVVARRFAEWEGLFTQAALDQLAISSGGDLREFFRLIRDSIPPVREDDQLPLSAEALAMVKANAQAAMLPIPSDHLDWLKDIAQTHETCLRRQDDLPVLAHFLDNRLVLNYRNGSDWYDVHPLLRDVVDAHAPAIHSTGPAA